MLKERPGDQPLPRVGGAPTSRDCQATVLARLANEIPARRQVGIERYGQALMPFNGRDSLRDCWEEILDTLTYFEQVRTEFNAMKFLLAQVVQANDYDAIEACKSRAAELLASMETSDASV